MGGIVNAVKTPLGYLVLLICAGAFAALTIAASISGALTAAMVSAAGFVAIVFILFAIKLLGD